MRKSAIGTALTVETRYRWRNWFMTDADHGTGLRARQDVTERLYHEDNLLNQRMYNFSTVQAFLTAALAFSASGKYSEDVRYLVALFGLVLALFYIPLGLAYVRGIQFLHQYVIYLESGSGAAPVDTIIFDLLRTGTAKIDSGKNVVLQGSWWARRAIYELFPWYLPGLSASTLIGVGTPLLATAFWLLVLSVLLGWMPAGCLRSVSEVVIPAIVFLFCANLVLGRLIPGGFKLIDSSSLDRAKEAQRPEKPRAI